MADTLLDAFVNVSVEPNSPVEQQLREMVQRLQVSFGAMGRDLGNAIAAGVSGAGGAGGGGGNPVDRIERNFRRSSARLQRIIAQFRADAADVQINVRLLGDKDVTRGLQDIRTRIQEQQDLARAAPRGRGGRAARRQAEIEAERIRTQDLPAFGAEVNAAIAQRGQASVADTLAAQLAAARTEAAGVRQELQGVTRLVQSAGDSAITDSLRRAKEEAQRLGQLLNAAASQGNIIDVQQTLVGLRSIQDSVEDIRAQANQRLQFNVDLKNLNTRFSDEMQELQSELNRLAVVAAGSLSGVDRVDLANFRKQIDDAKLRIQQMNREVEKTPELIQRIAAEQSEILRLANEMKRVQTQATLTNGTLNNLNNNMFQLGQAIEDFSVGFELNGLRGGIRGAANNVSFLLNNLAQSAERSTFISGTWKNIIALGGGIGAAVAILVIPRLVEWLQTLNDIKVKTVDITGAMEDLARRAKIELEIKTGKLNFRDAVRELDGFNSAVDLLLDKSKELEQEQIELFSNLRVTNASEAKGDFARTLVDLNEIGKKGIKPLERTLADALNPKRPFPGPGGGEFLQAIPIDPAKIAKARDELKAFNDAFVEGIDRITEADRKVREFLDQGVVAPDQMKIVEEGIRRIEKEAGRLAATGFISEDDLKKAVELISVFRKDYEKLVDAADLFQKRNAELANQTLKALQNGTFRLTQEYQFQADVNAGRRREEERILFEHKQQTDELKEQLDLFKEIRKKAGDDEGVINQIAAESEKALLLQQQIDLQKREFEANKDLQKKIDESAFEGSQASAELQFRNDILAGRRKKEEEILFQQQQQTKELAQQLKLLEDSARAAGASQEKIDATKAAERRTLLLQQQLELQKRFNDLQGEFPESRSGTADTFAIGVIGPRKQGDDLIAEMALLRAALEKNRLELEGVNQNAGAGGGAGGLFAPRTTADERRRARRFGSEAAQAERERRRDARGSAAELPVQDRPLTRDQQEADDLSDLFRLQQERARLREQREQRKAEEAERFRRSDEERKRERDDAFNELNKRARERAGESDGAKAASDLSAKLDKGLPFTSETIEKLLSESNRTLEAINTGIGKIDGTARLA